MKLHVLKLKRKYANVVRAGEKRFEIRINDRDFQRGDRVHFTDEEGYEYKYMPDFFVITYILKAEDIPTLGLKEGWCVFGFVEENQL